MGKTKWTRESILLEADKYTSIKEFRENSKSAYNKASTLGILKEVTVTLNRLSKRDWTISEVYEITLKYNSVKEFRINENAAYIKAQRFNILDSACSHMLKYDRICSKWTEKTLVEEAQKYITRSEFQYYSKGAYVKACRLGLLNSICSHMEYVNGATNLSKPMNLYYVKIITVDGTIPTVWKVGITKYSDIQRRFNKEIYNGNTVVKVIKTWSCNTGYLATEAETNIINKFYAYKYNKCCPLKWTKTTEMFSVDILKIAGGVTSHQI